MGLFDKMKKTLEEGAENVKKATQNLSESVKDINISESVKELSKKGETAIQGLKDNSTEMIKNAREALSKKEEPNDLITNEDALKVFYFQMAADDTINVEEEQKFMEIGRDLDPDFESYKENLIQKCKESINRESDPDYYLDNITESIGEAIKHSQQTSAGTVHPKLLLWNLIAISVSDHEYLEVEKKMLRSVIRWLHIDRDVLLEMESTVQTLLALQEEEEWLRSSDRQYSEVEKHLNEISDRKVAIMRSIHALIMD